MTKPHAERVADLLQDLRPFSPPHRGERPSRALAQRMGELCTPALSLAVIDGFEVVWSGGFGATGHEVAGAVSDDTLFQAASVSKPVFALAVMRMAKNGRVNLDADVDDYLASWRIPDDAGWRPRITLRQLLSHTAGTTVDGFVGYPTSGPWPTLRDVLAGAPPANNPPVVVDLLPGLQSRYSGGGTCVAQLAVTDVMGRPFPELMRELILDPLGMTRSTFEQPLPERLHPYAAIGHPWNGVPMRGGWHVFPEMAAAGLWTAARELARLGTEVLRILRGDASVLGLDHDTVREMLRPQLPGQEIGQEYRGLGWRCSGRDDAFRFEHRGLNKGYASAITLMPARGQGVVLLLNSNQGVPLIDEIVAAVGRQYDWPRADETPAVATPTHVDYAGSYRTAEGFTFAVTRAEGGLDLHFGRQPALPLEPRSRLEFSAGALNLQVRFDAADDGAIVGMTVTHGGQVLVAAKQT